MSFAVNVSVDDKMYIFQTIPLVTYDKFNPH